MIAHTCERSMNGEKIDVKEINDKMREWLSLEEVKKKKKKEMGKLIGVQC